MDYRIEHDSMGEVKVEADKLWGAQTQRSLENFRIGSDTMPTELIHALIVIKKAAAQTNGELGTLDGAKADAIVRACDTLLAGGHDDAFPLCVWQTGSGTQTNMNVNEVVAHLASETLGGRVHPNDDVNKSQSSNDVFPSAIHISGAVAINGALLDAVRSLCGTFRSLSSKYSQTAKSGRTHLQDAVPMSFGQELGGWRAALEGDIKTLERAAESLYPLALGGTAVGTGLNAPKGFAARCCELIAQACGYPFVSAENKFAALSFKSAALGAHSAMKTLACDLVKIANDVRWLASGPRCGIGEITIPSNEPGSSIMPGKVNPTQCEALTMVCAEVMGADTAVSFAASQGNFQLNVYMPLIAYNLLRSARLLRDAVNSFNNNCAKGIAANERRMNYNLNNSLMLVTALSPSIGYENAARVAKYAAQNDCTLREAATSLGLLSGEEYDRLVVPLDMI